MPENTPHVCPWPSWYHPSTPTQESRLQCPHCYSNLITITGRYGSPGSGPGGRGRLGDPGSVSWVECRACGKNSRNDTIS